jgi:hypothetical protein
VTMGVAFEGYLLVPVKIWGRVWLPLITLLLFIPKPLSRGVGLVLAAIFFWKQMVELKRITKKTVGLEVQETHPYDSRKPFPGPITKGDKGL